MLLFLRRLKSVNYFSIQDWRRHHLKRQFHESNSSYNTPKKMLSPREQFLRIHGTGNEPRNGYNENYQYNNKLRINPNYIKPRYQRNQSFTKERDFRRFEFDLRKTLTKSRDRYFYNRHYDNNRFKYTRRSQPMSSRERIKISSHSSHDKKTSKRRRVDKDYNDSNSETKEVNGVPSKLDFDVVSDAESFDDDSSFLTQKSISPVPSCVSSTCNNIDTEKTSSGGSDHDFVYHPNVILKTDCSDVLSNIKNELTDCIDAKPVDNSSLSTEKCITKFSIKSGCRIKTKISENIFNEDKKSPSKLIVENGSTRTNINGQYVEHNVATNTKSLEKSKVVESNVNKAVVKKLETEKSTRLVENNYTKSTRSNAIEQPLKTVHDELDNGYESVESEVFSFPLTPRNRTKQRTDKLRESLIEKDRINLNSKNQSAVRTASIKSPTTSLPSEKSNPSKKLVLPKTDKNLLLNHCSSELKEGEPNDNGKKKLTNTDLSTSLKITESDIAETVLLSLSSTVHPIDSDNIPTLQSPSITDMIR